MRAQQLVLTIFTAIFASSGTAQDLTAEQIARMLVTDMSPTRAMEGGEWFTNERGTYALGIIYVHVPGSAGTVSIHAGVYGYLDSGWTKLADVKDLYGLSPMDARFDETSVTLTTLTLGPDEPRCCPTKQIRWRVGLSDGQAFRLN
ncbi:MAG: hypothetical protein AAGF27_10465 [Pseudomonadota bacterium]